MLVESERKSRYRRQESSIITREFPTPIIEKFHRLINGVKDYPVMPYCFFALLANPFNFGVPEIFKMVMIICVQFMFPHFGALQIYC
jgi:hypothetical protein